MKISAKLSIIMSAVFVAVCLGFALTGFFSLGDIPDAAQRDDARGFAWFWTFLASVGFVMGALSYWIMRTSREDE